MAWLRASLVRSAAGFAISVLGTIAAAQSPADSCQAMLPRSLSDSIARAFRGYRTPLETDNAPEDIKFNLEHGGSGCLGVSVADFVGDGKKDYLVGLTALKGSGGLAVIAIPRKGGWRFQKIHSGAEAKRFNQYVEAVKPGHYDRAGGLASALQPDERPSIDCRNWAAKVGSIGSMGIVYCFNGGKWVYVWTAH